MSAESKAKIRASLLRSNHYGVGRPRKPVEPRMTATPPLEQGARDPVGVAHWQDQRAAERAAAKAKTDELRQRILNERAESNRREARTRGAKTFIGKPCVRHDSAERYVTDSRCVLCVKEKNDAQAGRSPSTEKLRINKISQRIPASFGDFYINGA
jgi:hypothetical protein